MIKNVKNQVKGITLIALVVTIIVLLILAGVAINLSIGNNGLFTRAENATNRWKQAELNEEYEINKFANTYDGLMDELGLNGGNNIEEETIKKPIVEITGDETKNVETEDKSGNRVVVPAGFKVVNPNDTVEDGIIIEDISGNNSNTVGNQFVWIPCTLDGANNTLKYDRYAFTRDDWKYKQTKLDEQDVDGSYKIQRADHLEYYFHEGILDSERKSIEKHGGYYIGRYEVGCDVSRSISDKGSIEQVAKVQSGLNAYNYITGDEAKIIAERMYTGKSRLCSSYAWDTALKFIDGETGIYSINSTGGNYLGNGGLKTTGYHSIKNIFDMGGNVNEWTSEIFTAPDQPYVFRGGYYLNDILDASASYRIFGSTSYAYEDIRG